MCMVCVDEVVIAAGIAVAAAPWYKTIFSSIVTIFKRNLA